MVSEAMMISIIGLAPMCIILICSPFFPHFYSLRKGVWAGDVTLKRLRTKLISERDVQTDGLTDPF